MWIARKQGHGCDGEQGISRIVVDTEESTHAVPQQFSFNNEGGITAVNKVSGVLSGKNKSDGSYTWTLRPEGLDESLTKPRNPVARNFGMWDGDTTFNRLEFRKNGFRGMSYSECAGIPYFHAQHIVRLRNKNGHAYFVVSNSDAYVRDEPFVPAEPRGSISVYRADEIDPYTDLVVDKLGTDGEIIWEEHYENSFIGDWNHPCKMEVIGNLLLVCALDWDGSDFCRDGYDRGSEQALLFYDVRDPEKPRYWGKMTKSQLGISKVEDVSLVSVGGKWILLVQRGGSKW